MYPKQRPTPPEVSEWMAKDLVVDSVEKASRFQRKEDRQNLIVSRRFFSNLLSLSFERYRKILTCNFEKNSFLKNQRAKSETSMPGLRPYVDQLMFDGTDHTSSGYKNDGEGLTSPSSHSLFSRPETRSDLTFNRRPQSTLTRVKTALPMKAQPDITRALTPKPPTSQRPLTGLPSARDRINHSSQSRRPQLDLSFSSSKRSMIQRPVTRQPISRERLDFLAQPKNHRFKSAGADHIRTSMTEQAITSNEALDEYDQVQMQNASSEKPKSAALDNRFNDLMDVFSKVHHGRSSKAQTVTNIIQNNTSLQDERGRWKMVRPPVTNRRPTFRNRHETLADKLTNKVDIFLIDVGA
ncbi:unnamed protein product [Adineta steineri]|uniref:Uncharacterized protein n=1 Tax=Adineta steineri TaxID=433720 RepID=A0A819IG93_9BILA|nr:unnamed protein product [Adineta steineri]CAF3913056.1 unnamed protein product [Adineta steineri]